MVGGLGCNEKEYAEKGHSSPGQHMARASIWITVASILATFNIDKAVDAQGNQIDPTVAYTDGIARQVKSIDSSFECLIILSLSAVNPGHSYVGYCPGLKSLDD